MAAIRTLSSCASFLSGTFYSIDRLPEIWQSVAHLNPFFYARLGTDFDTGLFGQGDARLFWLGCHGMLSVNRFSS